MSPVAVRCGVAQRNPRHYAPLGYSYEAQQPPLGYIPYVVLAAPGDAPRQALADARWGGTVWTLVAAGLLVVVAAREGLTLLELFALLCICLLSPIEVYSAATVTNDSAAVVAGSMVLLTSSMGRRGGRRMALVGLAVGLVIGLMKGFFLVAPVVLLMAGLLRDLGRTERPSRAELWSRHACDLCMAVGAGIAYVAWVVFQNSRALIPSSVVLHALLGSHTTNHLRWSTIFTGIQDELAMFIPYVPTPLYWLWNLAVFGTLAGLVLLPGRGRSSVWARSAAISVFAGLVLLAVGYAVLFYLEGHFNYYSEARFALPVLPIIALVVVRAVRRSGLLVVGVLLPGSAAAAQLLVGRL